MKAFFVTNKKIRCIAPGSNLIRHPGYVTLRVMMKDLSRAFSYMLPATGRVLYYSPPYITKIQPSNGAYSGGTEVYIEGVNFDISYGGIFCKFGEAKVDAVLIENQRLITCTSPPAIYPPIVGQISHNVSLSVSVDGLNYFSG